MAQRVASIVAATQPENRKLVMAFQQFNALPKWQRSVASLAFLPLCGLVFKTVGIPLPWLLGPLIVAAGLTMAGVKLGLDDRLRKIGQAGVGLTIGLLFSPEVAASVISWWWLIILSGLASVFVSTRLSVVLTRFADIDKTTAFFSTVPGGLAEMAGFASAFGANSSIVTVLQCFRILILAITLPVALTLTVHGTSPIATHQLPVVALLAGAGTTFVLAVVFTHLKVFNAWLLAGLAVGVAAAFSYGTSLAVPDGYKIAAQVLIGGAVGARFLLGDLTAAPKRLVPLAVLLIFLSMIVHLGLAFLISFALPYPTAVLATAPGGIAEMSLTATLLEIGPQYVTAWHLGRIVLVALLTGPIFNLQRHVWNVQARRKR